MGGLDSLDYAEEFQSSTGVTFELYWDETRDTWSELGVGSQHTVVVFDRTGKQLNTWRGFDGQRILDALN